MKKSIWKFGVMTISIICLSLLTACDISKPKKIEGSEPVDSNTNQEESYETLTVPTAAMKPTFKVRDVIYYDVITDTTQLQLNDIVIYYVDFRSEGEKRIFVSRIYEINTDSDGNVESYTMKSDNNYAPYPDPILPEDIVGIYVSIKSRDSD